MTNWSRATFGRRRILAARHPEKWALNRTRIAVEVDASDANAQVRALPQMLADCAGDKQAAGELANVAGLIGFGRPAKANQR